MEAPVYPPASRFVAPKRIPRRISARETPISDLREIPAAWAIVTSEMPMIDQMIGGDMIRPHLGNFSLLTLAQFGILPRPVLAKMEAQIAEMEGGK